ncbi:hypothetical protein JOQ06_026420, partial [Pogonophryne albipinna]
ASQVGIERATKGPRPSDDNMEQGVISIHVHPCHPADNPSPSQITSTTKRRHLLHIIRKLVGRNSSFHSHTARFIYETRTAEKSPFSSLHLTSGVLLRRTFKTTSKHLSIRTCHGERFHIKHGGAEGPHYELTLM